MITQVLIDYVKAQLSAGVTRDKITSDLLGQGRWTIEQINEAFQTASLPQQATASSQPNETGKNVDVWERIRKYNKRSLIVALVIFFVSVVFETKGQFVTGFGDLLRGNLGFFVWMMLGVLTLFSFFVLLENKYLSEKYANSQSKSDKIIEDIIWLRNFIFILNVIPGIQILGLMV